MDFDELIEGATGEVQEAMEAQPEYVEPTYETTTYAEPSYEQAGYDQGSLAEGSYDRDGGYNSYDANAYAGHEQPTGYEGYATETYGEATEQSTWDQFTTAVEDAGQWVAEQVGLNEDFDYDEFGNKRTARAERVGELGGAVVTDVGKKVGAEDSSKVIAGRLRDGMADTADDWIRGESVIATTQAHIREVTRAANKIYNDHDANLEAEQIRQKLQEKYEWEVDEDGYPVRTPEEAAAKAEAEMSTELVDQADFNDDNGRLLRERYDKQ